ncbi:unnamed protein product [Phytophthora lilii]|uniref:Unnamed protein product n=1 Tax=Phytophthora lilii TaxID=2077276 RepID=A0A9W6X2K1_9STRA|nr:unnamed protein product [Phytophthora lilii]
MDPLHRLLSKLNFPEFKIASSNPNEWQIDLAFWKRQPIFMAININSRIGYARLLKDKRADTVKIAIAEFIKRNKVSALMSDNGSEFTNKAIESFFELNSISHANSIAGDHTVLGKIDRFIRTIKSRLSRLNESIKFKKLTQKILNDTISNYNASYHSAINATPSQMKGKVMIDEIDYNKRVVKQVQKGIPVGSIVRYRLKSKTFDKEGAKYSKTSYEVVGLDGLKIRIRSKNNHILYKPVNDLKIVKAEATNATIDKNQIWEVGKLLDHKKLKSGKFKYLVKWKGYDEPSWEIQDNLRLVNKGMQSEVEAEYWEEQSKIAQSL